MLALLVILGMRFTKMNETHKAAWHSVHAFFALGELVYHGTLAISDYLDRRT